MTSHAQGMFEVKIAPLAIGDDAAGADLGRMSIDKRFHGDLDASSRGEMLTAGTAVKTSAAYVAVERVTGTLHGRRGTFALQHTGVMTRGEGRLVITVVPDSGTDQLAGLSGTMSITITGRDHAYGFDYTLAPAP
jgi:hypothetical protein